MNSSDLFQLIIKLPPSDRKALRKFVRSPFHNLRNDVTVLFDFFDKNAEHNIGNLTKEKAHALLYPGLPFDDLAIRRCMNYLMKVLEQYLVHKESTADELRNGVSLAAAYRKLGLEKHTRQTLEATESLRDRSVSKQADFYEKNYIFEAETLAFSERMRRTAARNLQQVGNALDLAYLAQKLSHSCVAVSHAAVANVAYESGLLPHVLSYLETADWLDEHPAIALYYYYYQAATLEDESSFDKLKSGIAANLGVLPKAELRKLYLHAINYTIQRYNKGNEAFLYEMFNLYRAALEQEILLENNQLSRFAFKNIAGIAIRLGEFDWAETFILEYSPSIEARHRKNYTEYNLAKLYCARREYSKAMRLLQKVEYEDVFLNLDAKVLLLKIYFEQGETDVLESFLQSFQRFLQRKSKELGYHKENYMNTLHFANKLLTTNWLEKTGRGALRQEILQTKAIGERDWLLEQLS